MRGEVDSMIQSQSQSQLKTKTKQLVSAIYWSTGEFPLETFFSILYSTCLFYFSNVIFPPTLILWSLVKNCGGEKRREEKRESEKELKKKKEAAGERWVRSFKRCKSSYHQRAFWQNFDCSSVMLLVTNSNVT